MGIKIAGYKIAVVVGIRFYKYDIIILFLKISITHHFGTQQTIEAKYSLHHIILKRSLRETFLLRLFIFY